MINNHSNDMRTKLFHKTELIFSVTLLILSLAFLPSQADGAYKLRLKNGKTIKTPAYRYAGNMIQYEMYGAFISIKKSSVISIEKEAEAAEADKSTLSPAHTGNITIPVYYQVTGTTCRNSFNGIYEADSEEKYEELPLYKNISGSPRNSIFYQCFSRNNDICAWVIGRHCRRSIYYVNYSASKEPEPVFNNVWENQWGDKNYPDISVQRISPPATVYLGRVNYISKNFPNHDCNGIFKPFSIKNGYVKYKMEKSETELEFSAVKNSWQIRYLGNIAYRARAYQAGNFPETIQRWEDVNRRPVYGKIEIFKNQ